MVTSRPVQRRPGFPERHKLVPVLYLKPPGGSWTLTGPSVGGMAITKVPKSKLRGEVLPRSPWLETFMNSTNYGNPLL